jgi:hypothetical protein
MAPAATKTVADADAAELWKHKPNCAERELKA